MKKLQSFALSAAVLVGVVIVSAVLSQLLIPGQKGMSFEEADRITKEALEDKCASCHKMDAQAPWTKDLSFGLIAKDMRDAIRVYDMDRPSDEVSLSKLQYAIGNGRMPPSRYTVVHWGSTLSADQVIAMNTWINTLRATRFSNHLADKRFASEPIQPIPDSLPTDPAKVELGKALYNDTRLSRDNTISCATCHELDKAGTDNLPVSLGIKKNGVAQKGGINAPTVFNAVFHSIQFWDGRAVDLKAQAGGPPLNPVEMGYENPDDWNDIIRKLKADREFTEKFLASYPEGYSADTITDAIAEYEKTLITPNSPFDKYLKGDLTAISKSAKLGYYYFKKHGCYTCHVGTAMGGQSFEFATLKRDDFFGHREIRQDDYGRKNFTKNDFDEFRFRVPNLRNVELTWPYMHDASCNTLEEAVDKMFVYLVGRPDPDATEKRHIVEFLRAQTGEYQGQPVKGQPAP